MDLNGHYGRLLGLDENWGVTDVALDLEGKKVEIFIEYRAKAGICPECGSLCGVRDRLAERTWRHLDTMQFETLIHARTPRVACPEHGAKVVELPWAGRHQRFTLLFEAFAVTVIQKARSLKDACNLLGLDWHTALQIMKKAVDCGLERRDADEISFVGMDEKGFLSRRPAESFATILTDIDGERVLDVELCNFIKTNSLLSHIDSRGSQTISP